MSNNTQHKLRIIGITALIIGTSWYILKYYKEWYKQYSIQVTDSGELDRSQSILDDDEINIESEEEEEEEMNTYNAIYGLFSVELNNLSGQETDFQIEINDRNNIELFDFNINNINSTNIHCRLSLRLKDYFIEFRIRYKMKDKIENYWSCFSPKTILKVRSSLISRNFKINEMVTFVLKNSNQGSYGKIIAILDEDCTMYKIEELLIFNQKRYHIVDYSRIYRNGPCLYNVIDTINDETKNRMNKTVLLGIHSHDNKLMDIFIALSEIYENYAKQLEIDKDIHYEFIGKFIAKNVMDFILCLQDAVRYNLVNCIMEYDDGFMKLVPVWTNYVHNLLALNEIGVNTEITQCGQWWCDLCGIEISRYDWIYRCDTKLINRHFFCLKCVWDIIQQNKELTQLLTQYLRQYLYHVCIQEIASFVCGSVVHSH